MLRPTFLGFETAKDTLFASQKGLDITGHNIANSATPGYTRQSVDVVSMNISGTYMIATNTAAYSGQGVAVAGVDQTRDIFLDKRFRDAYGDSGESTIKVNALTDLNQFIDEHTVDGIMAAINNFEAELQRFSQVNDKVENASIVLNAAQSIAQVFNQYAVNFETVKENVAYEFELAVKDANEVMAQIAALNEQIRDEYLTAGSATGIPEQRNAGVYGPNELLDDRNLLIDQLSRLGDVSVKDNPDGTVDITFAGKTVVSGTEFERMDFKRDSVDGTYNFFHSDGSPVNMQSGALKGYMEMINGYGEFASGANHTEAQGIPYYEESINNLANEFASLINSVSTTVDPVTGERSEIKLFDSVDGLEINAANIKVTQDFIEDPLLFTKAILSDGSLDPTPTQTYILALDTVIDFGQFEGTISEYNAFISTAKLSQQLSFEIGKQEADDQVTLSLMQSKDAISAVSLDEEAANLMNYQKIYEAAARVMTAMDEALDVIINQMGLVGR